MPPFLPAWGAGGSVGLMAVAAAGLAAGLAAGAAAGLAAGDAAGLAAGDAAAAADGDAAALGAALGGAAGLAGAVVGAGALVGVVGAADWQALSASTVSYRRESNHERFARVQLDAPSSMRVRVALPGTQDTQDSCR